MEAICNLKHAISSFNYVKAIVAKLCKRSIILCLQTTNCVQVLPTIKYLKLSFVCLCKRSDSIILIASLIVYSSGAVLHTGSRILLGMGVSPDALVPCDEFSHDNHGHTDGTQHVKVLFKKDANIITLSSAGA